MFRANIVKQIIRVILSLSLLNPFILYADVVEGNKDQAQLREDLAEKDAKKDFLVKNFLSEDYVYGNKNAKVKIIVYSAYSCPACGYFFSKIFPKIKEKYISEGVVALANRSYVMNNQDLISSLLVNCKLHNMQAEFTKVLYEKQNSWVIRKNYQKILEDIAKIAGVTHNEFEQCMNDEEIKKYLLQSRIEANKYLSINASPTIYVNGEEINNPLNEEMIFEAINKYL